MKPNLKLLALVIITCGMLGGCSPSRWSTDDFEAIKGMSYVWDIKDNDGVNRVLISLLDGQGKKIITKEILFDGPYSPDRLLMLNKEGKWQIALNSRGIYTKECEFDVPFNEQYVFSYHIGGVSLTGADLITIKQGDKTIWKINVSGIRSGN